MAGASALLESAGWPVDDAPRALTPLMGAGACMTDVFKSPVTQACVCRVHFFGSVEPVMCVDGTLELVPQKGCS